MRVLLVGINPGVRSSQIGHHFAGPSNRFWKLLYESRLVPEPIGYEDDDRLPEWGFGITNLDSAADAGHRHAAAATNTSPARRRCAEKSAAVKPEVVAFVGVTLFRSVSAGGPGSRSRSAQQPERLEGARVFVLPNPSGRNANFSYARDARGVRRAAPRDGRRRCRDHEDTKTLKTHEENKSLSRHRSASRP